MNLVDKAVNKLVKIPYSKMRNQTIKQRIERVRQERSQFSYNSQPTVSVVLQFFNKRQNIAKIMQRLRLAEVEEIIVIDDGSVDGSYAEWLKYLNRPNDFLLHCNDLFEVRTYDRAMRMAKGEYICLLQDDDIPPPNRDWVNNAIALFEQFPKLLILGGRGGLDLLIPDPVEPGTEPKYQIVGDVAGCPGVNKYHFYRHPIYTELSSQIPFMFSMVVNRAPTFLRREAFLELGGINQAYAPFQCDDVDACLRAWLAGYQVGLYDSSFFRDVGIGGMRAFNHETVPKQAAINWGKVYATYSPQIANGYLKSLVDAANNKFSGTQAGLNESVELMT